MYMSRYSLLYTTILLALAPHYSGLPCAQVSVRCQLPRPLRNPSAGHPGHQKHAGAHFEMADMLPLGTISMN